LETRGEIRVLADDEELFPLSELVRHVLGEPTDNRPDAGRVKTVEG
jgi:hypothetical protein